MMLALIRTIGLSIVVWFALLSTVFAQSEKAKYMLSRDQTLAIVYATGHQAESDIVDLINRETKSGVANLLLLVEDPEGAIDVIKDGETWKQFQPNLWPLRGVTANENLNILLVEWSGNANFPTEVGSTRFFLNGTFIGKGDIGVAKMQEKLQESPKCTVFLKPPVMISISESNFKKPFERADVEKIVRASDGELFELHAETGRIIYKMEDDDK